MRRRKRAVSVAEALAGAQPEADGAELEIHGDVADGLFVELALMAEQRFPKQIKLGARAAGWLLTEVEEWIEDRVAERD